MRKFINFSLATVLAIMMTLTLTGSVKAAQTTVDLKTAASFAILGAEGVTNVPTSIITGNVGLYPAAGSLYNGLTQEEVTGIIYSRNAAGPDGYVEDPVLLLAAKNDLTAAYLDAAGRIPFTTLDSPELGGRTLTAGVYTTGSTALQITGGVDGPGPLVLDAQGDPNAVFIFEGSDAEAGSLTVNPGGTVSLINGASACNVFWRVYGATILESAVFKGTILAYTSITVAGGVGTESNIEGRLLAQTGNVTLDHTTVSVPTCAAASTSTSTSISTTVLPDTGNTPTENSMIWYVLMPAVGIILLATLIFMIKRKKEIKLQ